MQLQELIAKFNTVPFLFAGSGITRRYYGLPNWEDLLRSFVMRMKKDRFAYPAYKAKAEAEHVFTGTLPMTASLIQKDFDEAWYADPSLRNLDENGLHLVESGVSPFKVELAAMIAAKKTPNPSYSQEIQKLRTISKKSLAGVITTNYDEFFETVFGDYKAFVGQNELLFSNIQGIAEIYKIHGSVTEPDSIVITDEDYQHFYEKSKYLAAKLMTIFMEYPIIFLGYSITDPNIRSILSDIVSCLPDNHFDKLQDRFVFVHYQKGLSGAEVSAHSIDLDGRILNMTKVTLDDYSLLYRALAAKKASIPVKVLRRFKEDIYTFVVTSEPGPMMQVAPLDSPLINEDNLAISIGLQKTGELGLRSLVDADMWYRDVVTSEIGKLGFSYDQLLKYSFSSAFRDSNGFLPVHKALSLAHQKYPEIERRAADSFESIASNTIKRSRKSVESYSSPMALWEAEKKNRTRAFRLLNWLPEEKMQVNELKMILEGIFEEDVDILQHATSAEKTDLRRLIRFYDYLRWGKDSRF